MLTLRPFTRSFGTPAAICFVFYEKLTPVVAGRRTLFNFAKGFSTETPKEGCVLFERCLKLEEPAASPPQPEDPAVQLQAKIKELEVW